jgi:HEAT repeat protein
MRGTAKRFLMLMVWTADLRLDAGALLLTDALSQRRRQCVSQLLSLLPLKYSPETIDLVNRNLQSPVANTRANAIEVLDNLLEKTDKAFCLPLLEEGGDERKLVLASEMFGIARREREQRLLEILHGPDRWLTLAAMMATATWGLHRMGSELRVLLKDDNPLVRETALVALHTLGEGALTRELVQPLTADPAPQVSRYAQHLLTSLA